MITSLSPRFSYIDSVNFETEIARKYVDIVKNTKHWYHLDEEKECIAVMVVLLCIGGSVAAVAAAGSTGNYGEDVELFLNENGFSEYDVHFG